MLSQFRVAFVALSSIASANTALGQIFTDDLSTGTNWVVVQDADSSAAFGYDYSQNGIPAAPSGGGDTIGLKFEVNHNPPGEINQIVAYNANAAYTGQYTLRADVWINWALVGGTVGTGTTEFAGLSVGHDGILPGPFGASFIFDGDGDSANSDYRLYKNTTVQTTASGQYATGTAANANDNTNPVYTAAFPAIDVATAVPTQGQTGTSPAGAGGFQWMTVNVEVDTTAIGPSGATTAPGFARISLRSASSGNTVTVGTIDNSNGGTIVTMEGSIALLMSDIFTSVTTNPAFSFSIFDNVRVFTGLVPLTPAGITGDYNDDGHVDAADYVVWRKSSGTTNDLPNDPLGGTIGSGQYDNWTANFGQPPGTGAVLGATPVPEPTSAMLTVIGLTGCCALRRRTISRGTCRR